MSFQGDLEFLSASNFHFFTYKSVRWLRFFHLTLSSEFSSCWLWWKVKIFCGSWLGFQWVHGSFKEAWKSKIIPANRKTFAKWSKKHFRFEAGCLTKGFLIRHCESFCDLLVSLSKINSCFSDTFWHIQTKRDSGLCFPPFEVGTRKSFVEWQQLSWCFFEAVYLG